MVQSFTRIAACEPPERKTHWQCKNGAGLDASPSNKQSTAASSDVARGSSAFYRGFVPSEHGEGCGPWFWRRGGVKNVHGGVKAVIGTRLRAGVG